MCDHRSQSSEKIREICDIHEPMTCFYRTILQQRAWIGMALIILFVGAVRLRLRDMPLERDEGEYAYSGQLMLQASPPYKLAYSMKFPGNLRCVRPDDADAWQTAAGIHLGLLLVNVVSIILIFLLGESSSTERRTRRGHDFRVLSLECFGDGTGSACESFRCVGGTWRHLVPSEGRGK